MSEQPKQEAAPRFKLVKYLTGDERPMVELHGMTADTVIVLTPQEVEALSAAIYEAMGYDDCQCDCERCEYCEYTY